MTVMKRMTVALVFVAFLGACQGEALESSTSQSDATSTSGSGTDGSLEGSITMTFWGGPLEKDAMERVAESYEEGHPGVTVDVEHVAYENYDQRLATMVSSGSQPDLAYIQPYMAEEFAEEGVLLDFGPYFENDPDASQYLEQLQFHYGDQYVGDAIAGEVVLLYYNRDLFDAAGIDYPPTSAEDAWSWDEFLEVAKALTVDRSGNSADSPQFDPNDIAQYGIDFQRWWDGWMTLFYMAGNDIANEDGTALTINEPDAVDGLQRFGDLIHKHHVAPTASQLSSSGADGLFLTGQLAMLMNGHWKILDYSQAEDLNWGIAVLPVIDEPVTAQITAPIVAFSDSENPDLAIDFYKYLRTPSESNDLYSLGLWMPIQGDYYTDEAKISEWLDTIPGVYPEESREVLIEYAPEYSTKPLPVQWLKNLAQIQNEAIQPAIELVWSGEATAQEAMDQAVADAAPMMKGRWDN
ncbi:MAG: sugar ABC transporter substrate-binding protein [Acidimicrobiia bacterium]